MTRIFLLAFALALPFTGLQAQEVKDTGELEFANSCASCHGAAGQGDGPLADLMTVPVADLTTLSAQNDGVFPMLDVIMFIDGRSGVRGHGGPMPIWGDRYAEDYGDDYGAMPREIAVRGRVLSLAYYLEGLQQ